MSLLTDLAERFRALLFAGRQERELEEELRFHLDREAAVRHREGLSPEAARRQALVAFGGVEQVKEAVRDARGVRPLQDLGTDLRFALRGLRRHPGFGITAILVLGLGIGAATATFTVVKAVLIAQLPYPDADRLVRLYPSRSAAWANLSTVDFQAIREQQKSFAALGALSPAVMSLSRTGEPQRLLAGRITSGFFQALSVRPTAGRLVEARDEVVGAQPVTVLSHAMARQLFGDARTAVGQTITLDGMDHQVIGVLSAGPEATAGLAGLRASVWTALQLPAPTRRGPFWIRGIARLGEGVTIDAATRDLAGISERLFPLWASSFQDRESRFTPVPLRASIVGNVRGRIGLFAAAVGLVLLIAIANVATLMLVRASGRASELGVRLSLGASRARVARLLLVEGVTLTTVAGLVGTALALLGQRLAGLLSPGLPRLAEVGFDTEVLLFAGVATVLAGLMVSLPPIAMVMARGSSSVIRMESRRTGAGRRANAVRELLVVAEFALALPLLLGAGLLLNTFLRLQRVDPGFEPAGLVSASVSLPGARYSDSLAQAFWRRAEARAVELSGTLAAGVSTELPPDQPGNENNFDLVDHPVPAGTSEPTSPWVFATNGYFSTMGVRLLDGRLFTPADTGSAAPVVIVTRSWAERFFPDEVAVGHQLIEGGCLECPRTTIVGVVSDIKYLGLRTAGEAVYSPLQQVTARDGHLLVRSREAPVEALRRLRDAIRGLDPELPVVETVFAERLDAELADPRRWTAVIAGFGTAGLLLAALGVFGLMSFVVRQQRREIGVRIALGADPGSITWMIVRRGMTLAAAGAGLGLVLALPGAGWLRSLLFGVGTMDPATLGAVAAALLGTALLACWWPGRSAARISPIEAIASE